MNPTKAYTFVQFFTQFQAVSVAIFYRFHCLYRVLCPTLTTAGSLYSLILISTESESAISGESNSNLAAFSTPKSTLIESVPVTVTLGLSDVKEFRLENEEGLSVVTITGLRVNISNSSSDFESLHLYLTNGSGDSRIKLPEKLPELIYGGMVPF
ncbi:MAG: hypothetical protein ACYC5G_05800 [Candidatus Doudnabacteria bacterium]